MRGYGHPDAGVGGRHQGRGHGHRRAGYAGCGKPVIAFDVGGVREWLDDGINGFFAERQNSRDLIEKVEAFLALSREEREKMGLAGRRKVEEHFDRRIIIGKYMDVIGSLNR